MTEEELCRIEQGDPSGPGEALAALGFLVAIGGLLVFILWSIW